MLSVGIGLDCLYAIPVYCVTLTILLEEEKGILLLHVFFIVVTSICRICFLYLSKVVACNLVLSQPFGSNSGLLPRS